jgi:inhibitor of KinA
LIVFESAELKFINEETLLVEYGETLDDRVHQQVQALDAALMDSTVAQHIETLPTFRSLLIRFDVFSISYDHLLDVLSTLESSNVVLKSQTWCVPICVQGECAQDLPEVAQELEMSEAAIVKILLNTPLKLYMYGFAPGFAYLGGLDARLNVPRRATPRAPMPRGSLMIAGGLASLSSVAMPTGWYVLGQTPITMFSPGRKRMVPFAVGDELRFYKVSLDEFEILHASGDTAGIDKISNPPA